MSAPENSRAGGRIEFTAFPDPAHCRRQVGNTKDIIYYDRVVDVIFMNNYKLKLRQEN